MSWEAGKTSWKRVIIQSWHFSEIRQLYALLCKKINLWVFSEHFCTQQWFFVAKMHTLFQLSIFQTQIVQNSFEVLPIEIYIDSYYQKRGNKFWKILPSTFIDSLDFSTLYSSFIRVSQSAPKSNKCVQWSSNILFNFIQPSTY